MHSRWSVIVIDYCEVEVIHSIDLRVRLRLSLL